MSNSNSGPVQTSLPSQGGPPVSGAKPSPRGGLASVARLVKLGRCKNIVVVAGAGISTASGIPDFRSVVGHSLQSKCPPCSQKLKEKKKITMCLFYFFSKYGLEFISVCSLCILIHSGTVFGEKTKLPLVVSVLQLNYLWTLYYVFKPNFTNQTFFMMRTMIKCVVFCSTVSDTPSHVGLHANSGTC